MLALDTATAAGSVAVGAGDRLLAEAQFNVGSGHSAALLPAIDWTLRIAGISVADLGGVVVGGGPGSFTGVRIAAATAKGIVHARRIPLWAYGSLLATAATAGGGEGDRPVCALFDARRRDVYAACYRMGKREEGRGEREEGMGDRGQGTGDRGQGVIRSPVQPVSATGDRQGRSSVVEVVMGVTAVSLDELIERFGEAEPPLFAGDGAMLHRREIERRLGATVVPVHRSGPRAAALLWLQRIAPELGQVDDPAAWEPEYVRASGAERIAAARAGETSDGGRA